VGSLSRSPHLTDIGLIALDLVMEDESKTSSTSVEVDKSVVSCFSWIHSIWQSSGMTNVSSTTGDWNKIFLEKFSYQLKLAQEEVCITVKFFLLNEIILCFSGINN
jgi:hypothetical protein